MPDEKDYEYVRRLRGASGMSQARFGEMIGVKRITVEKWERGEKHPGRKSMDSLRAYEASIEECKKNHECSRCRAKIECGNGPDCDLPQVTGFCSQACYDKGSR